MKSDIRNRITLIIVVVLIGLSSFSEVYSLGEGMDKEYYYDEILSIDIGESTSQIDYFLRNNGGDILLKSGVETFTVDDKEKVYLSNFATGKVKIYYKDSYEGEIDISNLSQPRDIKIHDNSLYVFEDLGIVTELSKDNKKIGEYNISLKTSGEMEKVIIGNSNDEKGIKLDSMPVRLLSDFHDSQISVLYDNNILLLVKTGNKKKIILDNFKLKILKGQVYKQVIGIDNKGNIYILGTELINKNDQIDIEELIYKFSSSGDLLAVADTINEKNYIVPFKFLDLNSSGDVFQLLILEDMLKVFKLNFRDISEYKLEKGDIVVEKVSTTVSYPESGKDLASRKALYFKAVDLINYKWTYNPDLHAVNIKNVAIPYYLKGVGEEVELTGIPYCWGGFDSLNTRSMNQNWDNFFDAISRKVTVGNVGLTANYIPGTTGLDCSGFISSVLGLESRKPSWYFFYNNKLVKKINYQQLALMDILVKNGHMFFYVNKSDYGIRSIETNTFGSKWKVKYFNWSWRALRDMGYSARGYSKIISTE